MGPNVRVSGDDFPTVETWIASNALDSLHLTGTAMVAHPTHGFFSLVYTSRDGGHTWRASTPPDAIRAGSSDPMVAVGVGGTVYLAFLASEAAVLSVVRSEDRGLTWGPPAVLGTWDHEAMAVDHTTGRHRGRVYVAGEHGGRSLPRGVYLTHSDDDGRTFGPATPACVRPGWNAMTMSVLVLSDGALFVSCNPYPRYPERAEWRGGDFGFVLSTDGGATFSPFRPVATIGRRTPKEAARVDVAGDRITKGNFAPVFAVDARSGPYQDRLYAVWSDLVDDQWRLVFTYSADRGRSWAAPRPVSPAAPRTAAQWQQAIAVNDAGVVGILWYDTRHAPTGDGFDVYFTASVDGGATFLPEVKVSSASSRPRTARNATPVPGVVLTDTSGSRLMVLSAYARHAGGGDYIGMTVGAGGVFHPFWADSRTGAYQAWTARIGVERETVGSHETRERRSGESVELNGKLAPLLDPIPDYSAENEIVLPIRLRNVSRDTLRGPFSVEVSDLDAAARARFELDRYVEPTQILNADNGEAGVGAVFSYEHAGALHPGAVTEARAWRFRVAGPRHSVLTCTLTIRGHSNGGAAARR